MGGKKGKIHNKLVCVLKMYYTTSGVEGRKEGRRKKEGRKEREKIVGERRRKKGKKVVHERLELSAFALSARRSTD